MNIGKSIKKNTYTMLNDQISRGLFNNLYGYISPHTREHVFNKMQTQLIITVGNVRILIHHCVNKNLINYMR